MKVLLCENDFDRSVYVSNVRLIYAAYRSVFRARLFKHFRNITLKYSLRCSQTCHKILDIVRLRKLVLISRMGSRICVSISDWQVSYAPCDWSHSCEIYHAMLRMVDEVDELKESLCFCEDDIQI